jgi:hypothetical protein
VKPNKELRVIVRHAMANEIEVRKIAFGRRKILIRRFSEPYRGLSIVLERTVFIDVQNSAIPGCPWFGATAEPAPASVGWSGPFSRRY